MAVIGQLTIGELQILQVDTDPTTSGLTAPVSSIALLYGSNSGQAWLKIGTGNTQWLAIHLLTTQQQSIANAIIFG